MNSLAIVKQKRLIIYAVTGLLAVSTVVLLSVQYSNERRPVL